MIECERKFPSLEMLERIAAALEIDAPALFSTQRYPTPEDRVLAGLKDRIIDDLTQVIAHQLAKLNQEPPAR